MGDERVGCGDNSCVLQKYDANPGGMRTNGGCRCGVLKVARFYESHLEAAAREGAELRALVGRQTAKLASAVADKVRAEAQLAASRAECERLRGALEHAIQCAAEGRRPDAPRPADPEGR